VLVETLNPAHSNLPVRDNVVLPDPSEDEVKCDVMFSEFQCHHVRLLSHHTIWVLACCLCVWISACENVSVWQDQLWMHLLLTI